MQLIFLGTGDSQGVPRLMCSCSVCKAMCDCNVRTRSSLLIRGDDENLLIDLSPDFKYQYIKHSHDLESTPDVIITHAHNDHIGGIVDYSDMIYWNNQYTKIISTKDVVETLKERYPFITRRKHLQLVSTNEYNTKYWHIRLNKINHGFNGLSNGIHFSHRGFKWSYLSDSYNLSDDQISQLFNIDLLVIGAAYYKENTPMERRSLYDLHEVVKLKKFIKVNKVIVTHMSHDIDYYKYYDEFKLKGIILARDNLVCNLDLL